MTDAAPLRTAREAIVARRVGGAIFVCALVVRVLLLPTARFGGDEALFFQIGMDIVEGVRFPLLGTHLTDGKALLPGPAFLYAMALPLVFFRGPEAQYLFVEVLGAVTVALFWHALRRPFGERAAAMAGLLMAFSPWSALYADRTWNPNVAPLFLTLAYLAAVRVREDPSSRWIATLLPAASILAQFHMSAPVAWAGLFVLVAPALRRVNTRYALLGAALVGALYVPLLVHELSTGFLNTRNIIAETVGEKKEHHPTSFLWIPIYAFRFLTLDAMYHELSGYWGGPDEVKNLKALWLGTAARPHHPLRVLALIASFALALWAMGVAVRGAWARRREGVPWMGFAFLTALLANMALLGLAGKQVFGHYVTNLFPFVFVVFAVLGASLDSPRRRVAAYALVAVFCVGGAEVTLAISRRVDARIGLAVHRRTLEIIRADGVRDGNAAEPVRLDFTFRSSWYDWHVFASRALGMPIHFDKAAKGRRYLLVEKGQEGRAPRGAEGPVDVGHALLYRVR